MTAAIARLGLTSNLNEVEPNTVGFAAAKASEPYPQFAQFINFGNGGRANYTSFTVSLNERMSKGLQFQFSYSLARNLSDSGGYNPSGFSGATVEDQRYWQPQSGLWKRGVYAPA